MSKKDSNVMPPVDRGFSQRGVPRYWKGGKRSVAMLASLRYDPITELVEQHKILKRELEYHENVRDGKWVPLVTGKEGGTRKIHYNADAHMKVIELLISVGDKLLRYGYGRVPEVADPRDNPPTALHVTLSSSGDQWKVNELPPKNYIDVDGDGNPIEDDEDGN